MSHSAGLRVMSLENDFKTLNDFKNVSDSLTQFKDKPLISEPGTQYNYSNLGFQVVGAVIEAVLSQPFDVAIDDMFSRLGMNSTSCEKYYSVIKHRVRHYIRSDSAFLPQEVRTTSLSDRHLMNAMLMDVLLPYEAQWPSGAIVSTTDDLLTFANHLLIRFNSNDNTSYGKCHNCIAL